MYYIFFNPQTLLSLETCLRSWSSTQREKKPSLKAAQHRSRIQRTVLNCIWRLYAARSAVSLICGWIPVWQIETVDQNTHQKATCFGLLDLIFKGIFSSFRGKDGIFTDSRRFRRGFWNCIYCFIFCLRSRLCMLAVSSSPVCVMSTVCTAAGCSLFSEGLILHCKFTVLAMMSMFDKQ